MSGGLDAHTKKGNIYLHTSWCLAINELAIAIEKVERTCHQSFRSGTNIETASRNIQQFCHLGYHAVQYRLAPP